MKSLRIENQEGKVNLCPNFKPEFSIFLCILRENVNPGSMGSACRRFLNEFEAGSSRVSKGQPDRIL